MRVLFVHDTYYSRSENGHVYSYGAFPYALWEKRFLSHFGHITVLGRDRSVLEVTNKLDRSDGKNVSFVLLPNINTPFKRIFGAGDVKKRIEEEVLAHDAVIVRGPVEFAMIAAEVARKHNKPFAVEMSGCAFDHSWYHGSLIGKIYAPVKYLRARKMLRYADFVMYVTENFLQKRYPTNARRAEHASNVEIPDFPSSVLEQRLNFIGVSRDKIVYGLIGNFGNKLKGLGICLKAFSNIKNQLPAFELRVLGQGNPEQWLPLIKDLGLEDNIVFSGTLAGGDAVYDWLDQVDVYLQPSFHEGLPRALIEAMSRGCPALSSNAGGSEELLRAEHIHPRGDCKTLATHLLRSVDPNWQVSQAKRNFKTAKNYTRDVLKPRRESFWAGFRAFVKTPKG